MYDNPIQEARRQVEICNACRYCEGYCRSFPQSHLRVLSAMATSRIWPICATTVGDVTMPANTRIPMNLT